MISNFCVNCFLGDQIFEIYVGCPPGLSIMFDEESSRALARPDTFDCIRGPYSDIPCITVAGI